MRCLKKAREGSEQGERLLQCHHGPITAIIAPKYVRIIYSELIDKRLRSEYIFAILAYKIGPPACQARFLFV